MHTLVHIEHVSYITCGAAGGLPTLIRLWGWADATDNGVARPLVDAGEQPAAVETDGGVGAVAAVEERPDELPRAPARDTHHRLVAVVAGQDGGSLRWGPWADGRASDGKEEVDTQAEQAVLTERHCGGVLALCKVARLALVYTSSKKI